MSNPDLIPMELNEPSEHEQRSHDNARCVCYKPQSFSQPHNYCVVKHHLEKQELWSHLQIFVEQNKKLQSENDQLKSENVLVSQSIQTLETEKNHFNDKFKEFSDNESSQSLLKKKIKDLENDLRIKTKLFEDEKLKFLNTINSLQEQIDSFKQVHLQNSHLKLANIALRNKIKDLTLANNSLSENKELKSANDLLLANIESIQKENDHLQSTVSKLTNELKENDLERSSKELVLQQKISKLYHELQNKSSIFVSKEKKFLKIIKNFQEYSVSLEKELATQTTSVFPPPSKVYIPSESDLFESFAKQFEKIEKRIDSLKSKSFDILIDEKAQKKTLKQDLNVKIEEKFSKIEEKIASLKKQKVEPEIKSNLFAKQKVPQTTPQVNVPKKIYTSKSSKLFVKKVSQFTTYSLQKDRKYFEKLYSSGTFTSSSSFLSFSDNSLFISNAFNQMKNREWKLHSKVSSSSTHIKSFKYSFKKLFDLAPRPVCRVEPRMNDFVPKNPTNFKTPSSFQPKWQTKDFSSPLPPRKLFPNETPSFKSKWNAMSIHQIDQTYIWSSKVSKTIGPILKWVPKIVSK